jgi:hypothetical protein
MGRKSRLFAHSISSLDSRFAELGVEIGESLRPCPRIFPFWGDYRRRRVRSGLPPEVGRTISGRLRKRKCLRTAHRQVFAITSRPSAKRHPAIKSRRGLSRIAIEPLNGG